MRVLRPLLSCTNNWNLAIISLEHRHDYASSRYQRHHLALSPAIICTQRQHAQAHVALPSLRVFRLAPRNGKGEVREGQKDVQEIAATGPGEQAALLGAHR